MPRAKAINITNMKLILFLLLSCTLVMCKQQSVPTPVNSSITDILVYKDFESFDREVLKPAKTSPTLINFWATWCVPCMEEMPILLELHRSEDYKDINFVFVNMDFEKDIETKVREYITKENIFAQTAVLDAPKPNTWIDKVNEDWSGAMPFTMVTNGDKVASHNGKFDKIEQVKELIKSIKQ